MAKLLERFRKQEAENLALSMQFNRWSQLLIDLLIAEQEQKLLASDLPVDADGLTADGDGAAADDGFWETLS